MAAAAQQQQQQFDESRRSRIEEKLRRLSCKWNVGAKLCLMCVGVFFALWVAIVHDQTKADQITAWALACGSFLIGAAGSCWDLCERRKLKRILAEMQQSSTFDVESAGELRRPLA